MRLPKFEYLEPASLAEALNMKGELGKQGAILAGGTYLLVRMKHRLLRPAFLMSLKDLIELRGILAQGNQLTILAATSLGEVMRCELVRKWAPALAEFLGAAGAVTIHQFRGTIGGNFCQYTGCLLYNQSSFWPQEDHPVTRLEARCVMRRRVKQVSSTNQSEGATALTALGAKVILESVNGKRTIGIGDLFTMKAHTHPLMLVLKRSSRRSLFQCMITGSQVPMRGFHTGRL